MARKLNWIGKTVVIIAVALILAGAFFGAKFAYSHLKGVNLLGTSSADTLVNGFSAAVNSKNYSNVMDMLSLSIQKLESADSFAAKLADRFDSMTLKLEGVITEGDKGFAIFSIDNKTEYFTLPLVRESGKWKINYFEQEAKCSNQCAASLCKDDKVLTECSDTDYDGCTETSQTTCPVACSGGKCVAVKEIYTLKTGDVLTAFPSKIKIMTINSDSSVTLEVGDDMGIFTIDNPQTLEGLMVTVTAIGTDSITIKVKAA